MSAVSEKIAASQRRARQLRAQEDREREEGAGYQVAFNTRLNQHVQAGKRFADAQVAAADDVRHLWPKAAATGAQN